MVQRLYRFAAARQRQIAGSPVLVVFASASHSCLAMIGSDGRGRLDFIFTAIFLALVLAIGGARDRYPLLEMMVELAALAMLLYFCWTRGLPRWRIGNRFPLVILCLMLALPLLQLVPLPPGIWTALPGRELAARITAIAGLDGIWRPLSLDPEATRRSLLFLLPGVAMFVVVGLFLPASDRPRLLWIVLGFAFFGVFLGGVQLASGDGSGVTPFRSQHTGYAVGLFVNRNQHATFLLVAMLMAGSLGGTLRRLRAARMLIAGAILLLAVGVVATTSRTGTATIPFALVVSLLLLFHDRMNWRVAGAGAVGLLVIGVLITQSQVVDQTLARYGRLDDARFLYWRDVLWALPQYWPAGTGIGTFDPIYRAAESLENVGPYYVNHAHNDYLELALTGGLPALIIFALFVVFLLVAMWRIARGGVTRSERMVGLGALAGITVILAHSYVEYPLRTLTLEVLFGLLCGLLLPPAEEEAKPDVG